MINTREVVATLRTLESVAIIPRVSSTNLIARRIVKECIDNELSLPQAIIIAGEQFAGRGRNERVWSSPPGKGIYATMLLTRPADEMPFVPLLMASILARYLIDTFGIDARIKWPNDVMADGHKIAGILIEARVHEGKAYMLIGIGVNVEPVQDDNRPNATAIRDVAARDYRGIEDATRRFIDSVDAGISRKFERAATLDEWRRLSIHRTGDAITCVLGDRTVSGAWGGIDEHGRALLKHRDQTIAVSAGDLILT
jgi:BirA family transcriptional regulator, biotin operon repressor / biotin---[acetyl-CoA-carboxylase] ligase